MLEEIWSQRKAIRKSAMSLFEAHNRLTTEGEQLKSNGAYAMQQNEGKSCQERLAYNKGLLVMLQGEAKLADAARLLNLAQQQECQADLHWLTNVQDELGNATVEPLDDFCTVAGQVFI